MNPCPFIDTKLSNTKQHLIENAEALYILGANLSYTSEFKLGKRYAASFAFYYLNCVDRQLQIQKFDIFSNSIQ